MLQHRVVTTQGGRAGEPPSPSPAGGVSSGESSLRSLTPHSFESKERSHEVWQSAGSGLGERQNRGKGGGLSKERASSPMTSNRSDEDVAAAGAWREAWRKANLLEVSSSLPAPIQGNGTAVGNLIVDSCIDVTSLPERPSTAG
jgi:hypothetical protein